MKVSIPLLATIAAFITGVPAQADSFLPPSVQEASSADGSIVVTVVPAMLSCAVGEADCEPAARAIVEHFRGDYRSNSRTVRLLNPQAPARVLVTDDGERLLTVDDYASYGFGENVLVVYGSKGEVIARHALKDFLPQDYINGLPRTVSTLRWWGAAPRIEPGTHRAIISLHLVGPDSDIPRAFQGPHIALALDLDTGEIESPSGTLWENALNCARANSWLVPDVAAERQRERYRQLCR
ncbi:hypothetical protein [Aurantiacibacter zhengii]|uniref:Uncharacterized protein n=1 Tax=Aurantiacibacter zhengii TaxID=2307003 RepID=A0A418NPB0_9SPHN|nr:hypothetical protein [Aurantiacibacter zhengii]RIV83851.1 hypothetical protein D2V07_15285 [Aurantiacibacter zhengii]